MHFQRLYFTVTNDLTKRTKLNANITFIWYFVDVVGTHQCNQRHLSESRHSHSVQSLCDCVK